MAGTYYKYAERDADSEINWAEVGKGLSDMLAETNKVREEKKTALDDAQRQTMAYLAQTPNGEDASARTAALEYANQAANRMRIAKQQMEQGQMSVKDYTIFRQNLTDNTNLLFNANKAYQEEYARKMQRSRDGLSSALEPDRMKDAEMFGNWRDTGFFIGPNGVVMAGKMTEKDVNGKKVRTLDETPGNLRNIDAINQLILGDVDKYDWEAKANEFVDALGKNVEVTTVLGKIGAQGLSRSLDDITKRKDIIASDKQIMYNFVQSENDKIREIAGTDIDRARILMDSAKIAPNNQPYILTSDPKEAAKGVNYILKEYDPNTRGVVYKISDAQTKDAEEFIRTQMRAKYNKEEKEDVVNQLQLQESSDTKYRAARKYSGQDDKPEPVKRGEILAVRQKGPDGKSVLTGVSQRLENAVSQEVKGVDNVVTDIGYNHKTGTLEIAGYQVAGKESAGTSEKVGFEDTEDGETIQTPGTMTTGKNVVKKQPFRKNDRNSASLLSIIIKRIPNPETGDYFSDISQAKDYYKREYNNIAGVKRVDYSGK
jgi:hypothetical protein